jgi:hypothetical protein
VLGLVVFDSDVRTLMVPVEVTEARRAEFLRRVRELVPGSSTNLGGGLLEGLRLAEANAAAGKTGGAAAGPARARVILLTDGLANEGPAQSVEALVAMVKEPRAGAAGVSAFGYGDDCDQVLLGDVARAGGGSYAYIRNEDDVLTAFGRELGGLMATHGSKVRVRVVLEGGAAMEQTVAEVLYHNQVPVAFRVPVAAGPVGVRIVGAVEVSWDDDRGQRQEARTALRIDVVEAGKEATEDDPEVRRLRDERLVREGQQRAEKLAGAQKFRQARAVLVGVLPHIADPALVSFVRESLLPCYAEGASYRSGSGLRSSSLAYLSHMRQVVPAPEVAARFDVGPSAAEEKVAQSFTSPRPRKSGGRKRTAAKKS